MRTAPAAALLRRRARQIAVSTLSVAIFAACSSSAPRSSESRPVATEAAAPPPSSPAAPTPTMVVYKTPTCGCCKGWVKAMQDAGFTVEVHDVADLAPVKHAAGVPAELQACHTARIGGYVVEGHVPPQDIRRLLAERPDVAGIATPGMPVGSPGMEGPYKDHYDVMTFGTDGRSTVFASH